MSSEFVWRFDQRAITRASLNIGNLSEVQRGTSLSWHDAENAPVRHNFPADKKIRKPKSGANAELPPSNNNNSFKGVARDAGEAIGALLFPAALVFLHDLIEVGRNSAGAARLTTPPWSVNLFIAICFVISWVIAYTILRAFRRAAKATSRILDWRIFASALVAILVMAAISSSVGFENFAKSFISYLIESLKYVGTLISNVLGYMPGGLGTYFENAPWPMPLLIILLILWVLFHIFMYVVRPHQETFLTSLHWRLIASALVASFVLVTISRFFALFDEIKTAARPNEYLTMSVCDEGYRRLKVEKPLYLRIDPDDEIKVGESSALPSFDSSASPLVFEDSGAYGVVKRGDGVKPVAPAPTSVPSPIEPAYLSVRLCISDDAKLPAELADVSRNGGR